MPYRFLTYALDVERRELLNRGKPVAVSPKVFDVLSYLIAHRDRMVSKTELMERFWAANTSEAAMQKAISQMRKALGDSGGEAIKTYHGRGFRFVSPMEEDEAPSGEAPLTLSERRLVSVLCARLNPATGRGDNTAMTRAKEIVERHEGGLLHIVIDGFTASFGLNPLYEDGARRAVHCAAALAGIGEERPYPRWSLGVDSGAIGVKEGPEWALPGGIERAASALARMTPPGEIAVSVAVRDQLRDEIECEATEAGFRVLSVGAMSAGIPARPRKQPTRFVGRRAEMSFLNAQRDNLMRGAGQAIEISGAPGIGKTRLAAEFLASVDETALRQVKVQCLPTLANTPLAPIRALCLALAPEPPAGVIRDGIDDALFRELRDGVAGETPALQSLSNRQHSRRTHALIERILRACGAEKPLAIVFEDAHWMDATSRACLEDLLRGIDRKPFMAILTTRPSDAPPLAETVLRLPSLGRAESMALLRDACVGVELQPDIAARLIDRAEGNPFFIEELALTAQGDGGGAQDLPATVQAVIAARIGGLEAGLRAVVYVMAVIGPRAEPALIAHLLGRSEAALEIAMRGLVRAGFAMIAPAGFSFRHALIEETAYAMIEPADRKRLHGEIARHLENEPPPEPARPERLAWHHQEAGETARAVRCWIAASRSALRRSALHEAVAFAESGLALVGGDAPEDARRELDLLLCLSPALAAIRGFGADEVGEIYRRADRLNRRVGTMKTEFRVRVGLWIHCWIRGRLLDSLDHAGKLLALADRTRDSALLLQANASRGQVLLHRGEIAAALRHLEAGLRATGGTPPATISGQNAAASCAAYAAWATKLMGRNEEAERFRALSLRLTEAHESPLTAAIHYALCSEIFMFGDDATGCLAHADRAVELSREHDFAFWLGTGLVMRGWAHGRKGDFKAAFAALDEGSAVFEGTEAGVQLANWAGLRAEVLLRAGRPGEALAVAGNGLAAAARAGDLFFTPRIHAVAARAANETGATDKAAEHRREAGNLARRFGMSRRFIALG